MDLYTKLARRWLNMRFASTNEQSIYIAHEPIYGIGGMPSESGHAFRLTRLYQLLCEVRDARGKTLLDIGGGEGYFAWLCRTLLDMKVISVDLSSEACKRACELFNVSSCVTTAASLPFCDEAFDVVVMAEVAEHLAEPVDSILEMQRVARFTAILSTEEWCDSRSRRDRHLSERKVQEHMERNIFCLDDIEPLFAPNRVASKEQWIPDPSRFNDDAAIENEELAHFLLSGNSEKSGTSGIILTARKGVSSSACRADIDDSDLARALVQQSHPLHRIPAEYHPNPLPDWCRLQCPSCGRNKLDLEQNGYICTNCKMDFPNEEGVASFLYLEEKARDRRIKRKITERGGEAFPGQTKYLVNLDKKFLVDFEGTGVWRFRKAKDLCGWVPFSNLKISKRSKLIATGGDPIIHSPWIGIPMGEIDRIEIRYAAKIAKDLRITDAYGELFWRFDGEFIGFKQEQSFRYQIILDGKLHTYILSNPVDYETSRYLAALRLDPMNVPGEIELDSVVIIKREGD